MEEISKKGCQCEMEALGKISSVPALPIELVEGCTVLTSWGRVLFQLQLAKDLPRLFLIFKCPVRDNHTNKSFLSHKFLNYKELKIYFK